MYNRGAIFDYRDYRVNMYGYFAPYCIQTNLVMRFHFLIESILYFVLYLAIRRRIRYLKTQFFLKESPKAVPKTLCWRSGTSGVRALEKTSWKITEHGPYILSYAERLLGNLLLPPGLTKDSRSIGSSYEYYSNHTLGPWWKLAAIDGPPLPATRPSTRDLKLEERSRSYSASDNLPFILIVVGASFGSPSFHPNPLSREEALGLDKSKKRFDIREEYYLCSELSISALRYLVSLGGVTLMFIHGVSGHKEQYHTAITRLLSLRDVATHDIREIWLIDFPNHGEAATLNRRLLRAKIDTDEYKAHGGKDEGIWTTMDIAAYLHVFCHCLVSEVTTSLVIWDTRTVVPFDPRSIHGTANVRRARAKRDTWSSRSLDIGSRGAERVFGLDGTREYSICM
ncbi:hypothetical protein L210DRAFT_3636285, partial [Boletus edulis BED1]